MRKITLLLIFSWLSITVFAQTHIQWEALYCNSSGTIPYNNIFTVDMEMDTSGNTFTVGYGEQNSGDTIINRDAILLKNDTSGNLLSSKTFSLTSNSIDLPVKIRYASNENVYVLVNVSEQSVSNKCVVYCLDRNLVQLWQNVFVCDSNGAAVDLAIDATGNVTVVGNYYSAALGQSIFIHRIKSNLTEINTIYTNNNSTLDEQAKRIINDKKGNVLVAGYQTSNTKGKQLLILKYDKLLQTVYSKSYDGTNAVADDYANDIASDNLNNVYVTGKNYFSGIYQGVTIKYDTAGKVIWKKQFPLSPEGRFILSKLNNIYVAFTNFKMVKYNKSGVVLQSVAAPFGTSLNDFYVYNDSSYWMMGRTDTIVSGNLSYQGYVIKYRPNGTYIYYLYMPSIFYNNTVYPGEFMAIESYGGIMYTCARKFRLTGANTYCIKKQKFNEYPLRLGNNSVEEASSSVNVYPNPVKGMLQLYSENQGSATLFNVNGQIEKSFEVKSGLSEIDLTETPSGIYFLIVETEGKRESKKIIVQ